MRRTVLDSATKEALRKTVRALRAHLLDSLEQAAESEYRLQTTLEKAKLPADRQARRVRLEAWMDEQVRATPAQERKTKAVEKALRERFRREAIKEAAYTLLNRLVFLRILEHHGLIRPALISGGWQSPAYGDEFVHYSQALQGDDTRGYAALLEMLYAELALDLPGLFGVVGLTQLFPVLATSLREVIEALNEKALDRAWGDDMALGWVYQFWNDPERESLDVKLSGGGRIEAHEIASKTQMFTERYMVEWLLQNSLGQTWLALCEKNGWTPDFYQVRAGLDARRADWRQRRERGEVALDALMPLESELEERWKYWVRQPLSNEAVASAPASIRELKLLDPACGSGHFMVIAFDLLAALYEEEARHRGELWAPEQIAQSIVDKNLHGVDVDPRAIQLAAAALWLKAKLYAPKVALRAMNLVAPAFRLAALPKDDPAFERLCTAMEPFPIARQRKFELINGLARVDHLGTLLQVDCGIANLLEQAGNALGKLPTAEQADPKGAVRRWFAEFLDAHSARAELGLRLHGEQVAAGVRFLEIVRDGGYDVVVGNPPYQGTSKFDEAAWFKRYYPRAKADLYACFLERSLALTKPGGVSALLTMRGWLFLSQYQELREGLLKENHLVLLGDVDRGAFEDIPDEVVSTTMSIFARRKSKSIASIAIQPTPLDDSSRDSARTARKRAGLLAQVGRYEFDVAKLSGIEGTPMVYWWDEEFLLGYISAPKLADIAPARFGLNTGNNLRFLRLPWELATGAVYSCRCDEPHESIPSTSWARYLKGSAGASWLDPCDDAIRWKAHGLEVKVLAEHLYGSYSRQIRNERSYWVPGVAFTMIGNAFAARLHRYRCVIDSKGSSVYAANVAETLCLMNRAEARFVLNSLNPTASFQVGDVNRLPVFPVAGADRVLERLDEAFSFHESHREPSGEFKSPGSSAWRYGQDWAQRAVDRSNGKPLPPYEPEYESPDPSAYVSFAIGVSLGRFGANGEGILADAPATALPAGVLYLSGSENLRDSLSHAASAPIASAWTKDAPVILSDNSQELRDWLRKGFFAYHKKLYENRPIYFPLSSAQRSFVAFISIHRWADNTLQTLLADHLHPNLRQLDGEIADLNQARASSDRKAASGAERQYAQIKKLRDELADFITKVTECAERGAPPTAANCPARATDAPFHMDLDDGVMINSAALWPLLEPQWKDPKKWWRELCEAKGRKNYDWAHLAARYFPKRVDDACQTDPSLAVAHGCFWKYHPAKAYAWELRLAHEIGPEFAIDEAGAAQHRARFLAEHSEQAAELQQKERDRREKLRRRQAEPAAESGIRGPGIVDGPTDELPENDVNELDDGDEEQVAV